MLEEKLFVGAKRMDKNMQEQVEKLYSRRQARLENPDGKFDKQGRFDPSPEEWCDCCTSVRAPSRAWPYSYMLHCRTKKHVTNLVAKRANVEIKELVKA